MRRLILIVFCMSALISMRVRAQSSNEQNETQTLTQKVDSLEHELSYLKMSYELSSLNTDISLFANDIHINAIELQLELNNQKFNYEIAKTYQDYYESCKYKMESISELIEAKKKYFSVNLFVHSYSKYEFNALLTSYDLINKTYSTLERTMKLFKYLNDCYQKLMK